MKIREKRSHHYGFGQPVETERIRELMENELMPESAQSVEDSETVHDWRPVSHRLVSGKQVQPGSDITE